MAVDRDAFFAELDKLSEKQIKARLPLLDAEQLTLVQEYLDQRAIEQLKIALQSGFEQTQTAKKISAALADVAKARRRASVAMLFAVGAWLATVAMAVLTYLNFR
jgi:hypothetical protein